jgi:hypothetical protein
MQGKMEALKSLMEKLKQLDADEVKMSIKRKADEMPKSEYGMEEGMGSGYMGGEEDENEEEGIEISPEALAILAKLKK